MKAQGKENVKDILVNRLYLNNNFYLLKGILDE
jgi:hypothetical protein